MKVMRYREAQMVAFRERHPEMDDLPDEEVASLTVFAADTFGNIILELRSVFVDSLPKWLRVDTRQPPARRRGV